MGSPGSGKTSLIEKTAEILGSSRIGVIEGDLETSLDSEKLLKKGIPSIQITTGNACHLSAKMIKDVLKRLPFKDIDILFIENVGNLVCPAVYNLGEHLKVVLLSVPEGEDKPLKYPVMFKKADVVLITKLDLLKYTNFNVNRAINNVRKLNKKADIIALSVKESNGMEEWINLLKTKVNLCNHLCF